VSKYQKHNSVEGGLTATQKLITTHPPLFAFLDVGQRCENPATKQFHYVAGMDGEIS
jgi:hypothetical protein